ncbi:hypothetical protein ABTZ46_21550 [Nocardioides sp. NPDC126508]
MSPTGTHLDRVQHGWTGQIRGPRRHPRGAGAIDFQGAGVAPLGVDSVAAQHLPVSEAPEAY